MGLTKWLRYDLIIFCFSIVLCYIIMCVDYAHLRPGGQPAEVVPPPSEMMDKTWEEAKKWTGHAAIYWARIVYALLSFPFIFFWIPGLQGILTHTRTTGYNRNGICVPYTLRPAPEAS